MKSMTVLLPFLAIAAAQGLPPAKALPPPDSDTAAVLAPVNSLFAAFESGDAAAMLRYVYPDGRVTATGTRANSSGLRQQSWTQFAERLKPGEGFQERISDPAVEIDGDVAMVWAQFVVRVGGKVSNCGYDLFDLVRENGKWKIMNVTFSSRITDCPAQ
jgi:ketosteroid isomerase-like protein